MAYGINAPFGLRPAAAKMGCTWTPSFTTYNIPTTTANGATIGYATSLFAGDPVIFNPANTAPANGQGGYLESSLTIAIYNPGFTDNAPSTFSAVPILGSFAGCQYESVASSVNNVRFSAHWPASTQVVPGSQIFANVMDDVTTVFDVQLSTHVNANGNNFHGLAPVLPVHNPAGDNAAGLLAGGFGSNYALNIGGGTNFDTININAINAGYANNPVSGNVYTGQSAFYLDVATSVGGDVTHDYNKTLATLPLKVIGFYDSLDNVARMNPTEFAGIYTREKTPFLNVRALLNNAVWKAGTLGRVFA